MFVEYLNLISAVQKLWRLDWKGIIAVSFLRLERNTSIYIVFLEGTMCVIATICISSLILHYIFFARSCKRKIFQNIILFNRTVYSFNNILCKLQALNELITPSCYRKRLVLPNVWFKGSVGGNLTIVWIWLLLSKTFIRNSRPSSRIDV